MGTLLGNMEGAPLPGTLRKDKEIYQERHKYALQVGISLYKGLTGEPGQDLLAGTF
jgi:hypothetical protein